MKIEKIINNNIVMAKVDEAEAIIMGRGIGFKKKIGEEIPNEDIEKIFKLDNPKTNEKLKELIEEIEEDIFLVTQDIISYAENKLDKKMDKLIYVLLTDHISLAINRARENISLPNPMLWEIKNIYSDEFSIGVHALNIIQDKIGIKLEEDEAAFIALHIVNASLGEEIYNTMNITILTRDILKIIKLYLKIDFDESSLTYIRLVTHLKFFSQRIFRREQFEEQDELFEIVCGKYPQAANCVDKIKRYIKKQFNYECTNQELTYLILHIQRIDKKSK